MAQTKEEKAAYSREWRRNNPEKVRQSNKEWKKNNPEKVRQSNKKWRKNNPEKVRDIQIRHSWGFGAEHYDSLIAEFGGKCGCCGTTENLRLDHCHRTGRIRGVLCNTHNLGFGKIGDTLNSVLDLLRYILKANSRKHNYYVTGGKFGREVGT